MLENLISGFFLLLIVVMFGVYAWHRVNPKNAISRGLEGFWNTPAIKRFRLFIWRHSRGSEKTGEGSGPARNLQREKADSQGVGLFLCLVEALDQLWTKTPAFCVHESALDSARATESTRFMVGAVGIEIATTSQRPARQ